MDTKTLIDNATIAYYAMDDTLMTDAEYDQMFEEVYGDTTTPFELYRSLFVASGRKRELKKNMLSLKKARTQEEVNSWVEKMGQDATISLSPKYDGLAAFVEIDNGTVSSAVTRGDGSVGEDITYAVSHIPGVTELGDGYHQVEICMSAENMSVLNKNRSGNEYVHPRNAAAGVIRLMDSSVKDSAALLSIHRHFDSDAYGVTRTVSGSDDVPAVMGQYRDAILEAMAAADHTVLLDGVVLFAHDSNGNVLSSLGDDGARPRWAIAWKFPDQSKIAHISDVHWQIGRTKNTPVATFDPPVDFDGVMVSRASMHNQDLIDSLGVKIGDLVELVRSNEVIPYVTALHKEGENRRDIPAEPAVGTGDVTLVLENIMDVLDVRGAGSGVVSDLGAHIEKEYDTDGFVPEKVMIALADMIDQGTESFITAVGHFQKKSASIFREELTTKIVNADYVHLLAAMGFTGLGRRMFTKVMNHYGNNASGALKFIADIISGHLPEIDGFGKVRRELLLSNASDVLSYMDTVQELIRGLSDDPVIYRDITPSESPAVSSGGVAVITGAVDGYSRKDIKVLLEEHGWSLGSSVSGSTDVLFNASGKASSKDKAARSKNIPIVAVSSVDDILGHITG